MAEDTFLRDRLASKRTELANERTLLAYLRTAVGFAVAGGTVIHFLDSLVYDVIGWILVGLSLVVVAIGFVRFSQVRRELREHDAGIAAVSR